MKGSSLVFGLAGIAALTGAAAWLVFSSTGTQPFLPASAPSPTTAMASEAVGDIISLQKSNTLQESTPQPSRESKLPRKVIPWIEVNAPQALVARWAHMRPDVNLTHPNIKYIDHCIEGLPHWAKITDTVIVLTKPERIATLYPELMRRKPSGLHIVGGLKTFMLKDDYADPAGWQAIARSAQRVVNITGNNVVVLGSETPLTPFHRGEATIDFDKLRKSLVPLRDTGIQFWWHPVRILSSSPKFPNREKESTRLVETILDVLPDSVFLTAYTSWHGYEQNRHGELSMRKKMIDLVGVDHIHDRIFPTPDGYWHYSGGKKKRCSTTAEAITQLNKPNGGVIMDIFPGGLSWVQVAKEFAEAMPNSAKSEQP